MISYGRYRISKSLLVKIVNNLLIFDISVDLKPIDSRVTQDADRGVGAVG